MSHPNISAIPTQQSVNGTMEPALPPWASPGDHKNLPIDSKFPSSVDPLSKEPLTPNTPGLLPGDVYNTTLPRWRAAVRTMLLSSLGWQSIVLARMQDRVRTSWLDTYFVYTSSLGTHTFFLTFLPACFFFGYDQFGRGLLLVLALGVYTSSFVKDLFCVPRPFAPPVTRLSMYQFVFKLTET